MRLALVADAFPPMRTSAAVQLRDLAREFARQGHRLTVILPSDNLSRRCSLEHRDEYDVLLLRAPKTKDIGYVRRFLAELAMPFVMLRGLRASPLATEPWQGVIWYSPSIFFGSLIRAMTRRSGAPSYLILRDIFPDWAVNVGLLSKGIAYRVLKLVEAGQYKAADTIGAQSPGDLPYLQRRLQSGQRLEVLENWLGEAKHQPCTLRVAETALAGRRIFVYAGNMGPAQNMGVLIDLCALLRQNTNIGFLFVGRGQSVERLKKRVQDEELGNVLFHDEIDPDEIPDLYSQCDFGLLSLDPRHRTHNIPGKFLTYMQAGLPVLACVNPGSDLIALIDDEGVGCVSDDTSPQTLKDFALALVATSDDQMRDRCRALSVRKYSSATAVRQIIAALRSGEHGRP